MGRDGGGGGRETTKSPSEKVRVDSLVLTITSVERLEPALCKYIPSPIELT